MKRLIQLISLLLLISILLTSCATYNAPIDDGNLNDDVVDPDENPGEDTPDEEPPGEEEEGEKPYTVTLNVNGKDYKPNASGGPYYVQWSNGFSVHTAELINGKAEIYGLDDDYTVTLLNVPSGYVYNPNAYVATTDKRDVSIELIKPQKISGSGSDEYSRIALTKTGVYQITINSATQVVYFHYRPTEYGNYTIESWVDVTENNVNPTFKLYHGTSAGAIYYDKDLDGGGKSSTYTKNFKYDRTVYVDEIGTTGGSMIIPFAIKATAKNGEYPITITFAITKDGEMDRDGRNVEFMIPEEDLQKTPNYSSVLYTLTGTEVKQGTNNVFNGDMFKIWDIGTGMPMVSLSGVRDGSIAGALSGSYEMTFVNARSGRRIVRTITFTPLADNNGTVEIVEVDHLAGTTTTGIYSYSVCTDHTFSSDEDMRCDNCSSVRKDATETAPAGVRVTLTGGSKIDFAGFTFDSDNVLYYGQGDNFYHFYDAENGTWGEILYAYVSQPCRFIDTAFTEIEYKGNKFLTVNAGTQNYKFFIEGITNKGAWCVNHAENQVFCPCLDVCGGACAYGCENCHIQCTNMPPEAINSQGGYANYTNQDGVYGVTAELKEFLQQYSTSQLLFMDGNGWVETNPDIQIYSTEEDQWLFACGYYEKN